MTDIQEATDGGIAAAAGAIERYCDNHGIPMPSPSTALLMATLAQPHIAAAERERIQRLGASPLAGKCAYEAFAAATRHSLNLPSWERLPPDVHADWQATADAVLMLADLLRDHP